MGERLVPLGLLLAAIVYLASDSPDLETAAWLVPPVASIGLRIWHPEIRNPKLGTWRIDPVIVAVLLVFLLVVLGADAGSALLLMATLFTLDAIYRLSVLLFGHSPLQGGNA